jgi:NAD(P)-dependent dehydrogenase (short-subunit alcohol dehydrogenase family)
MDPKGKIAVVTGAAGGIGGAIVRALVANGARTVVATDIRTDGLPTDGPVVARALDVADADATQALVDSIEAEYGPIDLWFANAGVAGGGGADAPDSTWDLQWRVNVLAHAYAARALLPGWTGRGPPHHDGVDGRHPHVARRRRLRRHEARRRRLCRVAGHHLRRAGREGVVHLPGRGRHGHAAGRRRR